MAKVIPKTSIIIQTDNKNLLKKKLSENLLCVMFTETRQNPSSSRAYIVGEIEEWIN